jgi:hypothetical protein
MIHAATPPPPVCCDPRQIRGEISTIDTVTSCDDMRDLRGQRSELVTSQPRRAPLSKKTESFNDGELGF